MTLTIYLKSKRKPIELELDSESQIDNFYKTLQTKDIIKYGPIIFCRENFDYAIINE